MFRWAIIRCEQMNKLHWIDLARDDVRSCQFLCRFYRSAWVYRSDWLSKGSAITLHDQNFFPVTGSSFSTQCGPGVGWGPGACLCLGASAVLSAEDLTHALYRRSRVAQLAPQPCHAQTRPGRPSFPAFNRSKLQVSARGPGVRARMCAYILPVSMPCAAAALAGPGGDGRRGPRRQAVNGRQRRRAPALQPRSFMTRRT